VGETNRTYIMNLSTTVLIFLKRGMSLETSMFRASEKEPLLSPFTIKDKGVPAL
jgi:hypothetical protein